MKKATGKASEMKPESDKAKRVYRAALDTIRKLDDILKQKKAYRDVFLPDAIGLRNRLKDYCERLMFYDPLEYGRKAEELLWRKVFYDIIQLMKQNKKGGQVTKPAAPVESAFRTHLAAATGYYHHLLFRLQVEFNLKLEGVIDFHNASEPKSYKKLHSSKKTDQDSKKIEEWATRACHRCVIYLGDIARYQQEYDGSRSVMLSRRYYYQALAMFPDIGMPHNQLGTLSGGSHYNVLAAYHYLRCLMCPASFEGAQGNLTRLFEKNRKRYNDVIKSSPRDLPPEQQRIKDIKRFLVRFMHLLDILHSDTQSDPRELQEHCQLTLQDFNLCMFYLPTTRHKLSTQKFNFYEDRPHHLDNDVILKIVVMVLITIHQLQQSGSKQVTAAIAFNLALFSHILNHVVIRLQAALYEAENPRKVLEVDSADDEETSTSTEDDIPSPRREGDEDEDKSPDTIKAVKRTRFNKMRKRRRRRLGSEGSEHSLSSESDLSEGGDVLDDIYSDSEEEVNFMDTDSSHSDSDDLMESQELTPGFGTEGNTEERGEDRLDLQALQQKYTAGSKISTLNSNSNSSAASKEHSGQNGLGLDGEAPGIDPNALDLLENFPSDLDLFMASTNFLQGNFKFANMLNSQQNDVLGDVAQGKKEVRVPPGFDKDPETEYVKEISEKLAHFVIDTDTDTSLLPTTDTDNSSFQSASETNDESGTESVIDKSELEATRLNRLLDVISKEGLISTIKIFCDWVKCHPQIISTCAQSSQSLWSRLSVLLNFVPLETDIAKPELCHNPDLLSMIEKAQGRNWVQTQPLHEDLHTQGLAPLKPTQKTMVFDVKKKLCLSEKEEALIRICCLRKFGYNMAKMKNISLSYDPEKGMFFGPMQVAIATQQDQKTAQEKMADAEARRNQLMRDMAQLRLQAEVSQLEGSLQSSADQPSLPPYLVPDTAVLCEKLALLKHLTNSARFIIIVPLAVIDHLDVLKKESQGAREAIRWLEAEFRKGNRYIRSQKNHEKTNNSIPKTLKKKDKEAWRFFHLVDCCKYLSQQSTEYETKGMVSILTQYKLESPDLPPRVHQAFTAVQQEGVDIQNVEDFYNKWKEIWKNKG